MTISKIYKNLRYRQTDKQTFILPLEKFYGTILKCTFLNKRIIKTTGTPV